MCLQQNTSKVNKGKPWYLRRQQKKAQQKAKEGCTVADDASLWDTMSTHSAASSRERPVSVVTTESACGVNSSDALSTCSGCSSRDLPVLFATGAPHTAEPPCGHNAALPSPLMRSCFGGRNACTASSEACSVASGHSRGTSHASSAATHERPRVSYVRLCDHNVWENVRVKKGLVTLRCRVCQSQWRQVSGTLAKCREFPNCPKGDACTLLHVHSSKLKPQASGAGSSSDAHGSPASLASQCMEPQMPAVPILPPATCSIPEPSPLSVASTEVARTPSPSLSLCNATAAHSDGMSAGSPHDHSCDTMELWADSPLEDELEELVHYTYRAETPDCFATPMFGADDDSSFNDVGFPTQRTSSSATPGRPRPASCPPSLAF